MALSIETDPVRLLSAASPQPRDPRAAGPLIQQPGPSFAEGVGAIERQRVLRRGHPVAPGRARPLGPSKGQDQRAGPGGNERSSAPARRRRMPSRTRITTARVTPNAVA